MCLQCFRVLEVKGNYCACQYYRKACVLATYKGRHSLWCPCHSSLINQSLTDTMKWWVELSVLYKWGVGEYGVALWWLGLCVVNDPALVWLREWRETGVMLLDQENNTVGYSKAAARRGVTMVALSRILMAVPSCGKTLVLCLVH